MSRRALLSRLGLTVLVFGAVWIAVVMHWRATHRVPNGVDVALYFVVLPVALLLGVWAIYRSALWVKRKRGAPAAAKPNAAATPTATPEDASLGWHLPLVAVGAVLPAGDSPAALVDAARAGKRVDLHPALQDGKQQPVFAAEVAAVDVDALDASLPTAAQAWPAARKRTLALAAQLATRMLDEHFEALRIPHAPDAPLTRTKPPVLHVEWLLPVAWNDAERELARSWLAQRLSTQGWCAPELQLEATAVADGAAALKRVDDLNRSFNQTTLVLPQLLLASASHVDAASVSEWDARHCLHAAANSEGKVPGEGASALLVVPATHHAERLPVQVGRLFAAQRAKPVDQPQRLQADTLKSLVEQAQAHTEPQPVDADALQLVTDTDMRSSRGAEALHLAETLAPEQDPAQVLLAIGVANGHAGAALALALVAVAAHVCTESRQTCLILSNHDPLLRAVMQVTPAPQPAADSAASMT